MQYNLLLLLNTLLLRFIPAYLGYLIFPSLPFYILQSASREQRP